MEVGRRVVLEGGGRDGCGGDSGRESGRGQHINKLVILPPTKKKDRGAVTRVEEVKDLVRSLRPCHGGWVAVATEGGWR